MSRIVSIRLPSNPTEADFFLAYPLGQITISKALPQYLDEDLYTPTGWLAIVTTGDDKFAFSYADASNKRTALALAIQRHEQARVAKGLDSRFPNALHWVTMKGKVYL